MVEKALDAYGGELLYIGDHIFTDVSQSKVNLKWRTALICREMEREVVTNGTILVFVCCFWSSKLYQVPGFRVFVNCSQLRSSPTDSPTKFNVYIGANSDLERTISS